MEIKVAVIEDQKELRDMLALLINGSSGFTCTGRFENFDNATAVIPALNPDVVLPII